MYTKMFNFISNQSGQLKQKPAFPVSEAKYTGPRAALARRGHQRLRGAMGDPRPAETTGVQRKPRRIRASLGQEVPCFPNAQDTAVCSVPLAASQPPTEV